jgi:hypothetical protein
VLGFSRTSDAMPELPVCHHCDGQSPLQLLLANERSYGRVWIAEETWISVPPHIAECQLQLPGFLGL